MQDNYLSHTIAVKLDKFEGVKPLCTTDMVLTHAVAMGIQWVDM